MIQSSRSNRSVAFHWLTAILLIGCVVFSAAAQHNVSVNQKEKERESEPVKSYGSPSAPIKMEVFSDFQCPACRMLYEQTLKLLINDYVASGKVYLVYRDFPLPQHPYSYQAALYANAAARIGRFADCQAALFDNQQAWSADGNVQKFVAGAMSTAEMKRVQKMVDSCAPETPATKPAKLAASAQANEGCTLDSYIKSDVALANSIPVTQTPTSQITCKGQHFKIPGVISYPILKQFFDRLLSQ